MNAPLFPRWTLELGAVTATQRSGAGLGLSEMIFAERVADVDDPCDDELCVEDGELPTDDGDPCVAEDEFRADDGEPDVELGDVEELELDDELEGDVGEFVPDDVVDDPPDGDDGADWLGFAFELDDAELEAEADAVALDEAETNDTHCWLELGAAAPRTTAADPMTDACATPWAPTDSRTPPPTRPTTTARTCTKHIKIVLFCPAPQANTSCTRGLGVRDDQKPLFRTSYSYPIQRELCLSSARLNLSFTHTTLGHQAVLLCSRTITQPRRSPRTRALPKYAKLSMPARPRG